MQQETYIKNKQHPLWLGNRSVRSVKDCMVYQGDNLEIMKELENGKVDLIYIDPPFCSQVVQKSKAWNKKIISFNDEWGGGVHSYIRWLAPRLKECHRLLKETGVFCLHLDDKACHYAKIELDNIFGYKNFVNQIIWEYNQGIKASSKKFLSNHDTLLIYSKSSDYKFNPQIKPYTEKQMTRFKHKDQKGLFYFDTRRDKNNRKKRVKVYLKKQGTPIGNVWYINRTQGKERVGYPTQKPLALINRLISAFTDKGDMVLDAFCGCGTTISSAQDLDRRWVGIDISKGAIKVIQQRLQKEYGFKPKVIKVEGMSRKNIYKLKPLQFEKQIIKMIGGVPSLKQKGDKGVDGYSYGHTPIQVKMSFNVGRGVLDKFYKHIKTGNGKGIIIARSFTHGMYEEVNRLYNEEGLMIDLILSDDIVRDVS